MDDAAHHTLQLNVVHAPLHFMTIQILPAEVAARIAAGEVVERPANVAKELIENSIDAEATEIRVEIRDGGQRLLRITDNGIGIASDQVALAFERHATSKLRTAEDLNAIGTFGFRGEALYSIAAVSQMTLISRCGASSAGDVQESESGAGVRIRLDGGAVVEQSRVGTPPGTVISVENLFYNMPARLKFLRKAATEAGRISAVIQRYALAYPDRRFSYVNNGKLVFQSAGTGNLFDVLVKIYGLENAKQMVPIGPSRQSASAANHLLGNLADEVDFMSAEERKTPRSSISPEPTISGYVSLPTMTRSNRNAIDLFVNRRYVEDRNLSFSIIQAFHTLLPGGRFPLAAVFIDLDPAQVDVNVHPQKTQVRFVEDRRVYNAVQRAIRHAIVESAPVPDLPLPHSDRLTNRGYVSSDPARAANTAPSGDAWSAGDGRSSGGEWAQRRRSIIDAGRQHSLDLYVPPPANPPPLAPAADSSAQNLYSQAEEAPAQDGPVAPESSPPAPSQGTAPQSPGQLPPLRVVGQVGTMYIITEGPEGLYLIDQHAAHERILYEKLMAEKYAAEQADTKGMDGAANLVASQALLEPLTLHAGSEMAGFVAQYMVELNRFGFEIEPFGGDTFLVRAVPSILSGQDPLRILEEIIHGLLDRRNLVGEELEARLVKMICKRASIKAGQLLSDIEMQELVRQLEACQSPRTCPHGRPTMIQLSAGELEKAFGRV